MEQYEYRHDLTVGHAAGTVAMTLAWHLNSMFFQLWGKKFQNSSRIQKNLLNLRIAMGMGIRL